MAGKGHIEIMTFGYGFGGPGKGFAHVADVRNVPATKDCVPGKTGLMKQVHDEIMNEPAAKAWLSKMEKWDLKDGDKVAIGCARGHHRSVAIAHDYAAWLRSQGWEVTVKNRDINHNYTWIQAVENNRFPIKNI
jgi:RNase adaptor protein for sRNA GlmZ degradation